MKSLCVKSSLNGRIHEWNNLIINFCIAEFFITVWFSYYWSVYLGFLILHDYINIGRLYIFLRIYPHLQCYQIWLQITFHSILEHSFCISVVSILTSTLISEFIYLSNFSLMSLARDLSISHIFSKNHPFASLTFLVVFLFSISFNCALLFFIPFLLLTWTSFILFF